MNIFEQLDETRLKNFKRYTIPLLAVLAGVIVICAKVGKRRAAAEIEVSSNAFSYGDFIPDKYTGDGEDISPPLTFKNVPKDAKSLALIVEDPDAPGTTWNHWLAWNIDPKTEEIAENSRLGGAILGTNDFHKLNYGGPKPPAGVHRYYFKVFALDNILDLPKGSSREQLEKAIENHILAQGSLMGKYAKK